MQSQKENLGAKIDDEVRRIIETVKSDVQVARARVSSLQKSLEDLTNRSQSESLSRVKLTELSSAAASNRAVFEAFLGRFKERLQVEDEDTVLGRDHVSPAL